ncbi:membrane protein [Alkalihalobacillus pseudalcaliphilus]|uniref:membrane protein n=1 Tax=Alkalihalobacillus pseudalcaliphilus TaxID=79884 RepID=UPI00064DD2A2|nr:membrane protein [Alkalihalobacillus pseudalcaliphilus]KMK75212.1 membrane protein [Alkalihalobacillus pseudalcaliphilus]
MFEWSDFTTAFWAFFLILPIVSFIHQLGHWTMAKMLGGTSDFVIGKGRKLFKIGPMTFKTIYFADSSCSYKGLKKNSKLSHILVHSGGFIFNISSTLLLNGVIIMGFLPETAFFYQFGYFSMYYVFFALLPIKYSDTHVSDGLAIYEIIRNFEPKDVTD